VIRRASWLGIVLTVVMGFLLFRVATERGLGDPVPQRPTSAKSPEGALRLMAPRRRRPPSGPADGVPLAESAQDIAIPSPRVLEVSVVEDATERPVPGASVHVRALRGGADLTATTDADGMARFEGAAQDAYVLDVASASEHVPQLARARRIVQGLARHEVRLAAPPLFTARVVDEDGRAPQESVRLGWMPIDRDVAESGSMVLGPDGVARLALSEGLWGFTAQPTAETSDLVYVYVGPIEARVGEVTISLHRGVRVQFGVVDAGTGLPPAGVVHFRVCPSGRPFHRPLSHGHARLSSRLLSPGRYDVYVALRDAQGRVVGRGEAKGLVAGAPPLPIPVEPGGSVSGIVLDEDGRPPGEPRTVVLSADHDGADTDPMRVLDRATTDPWGRFEFRGVPPWPVRLEVLTPNGPIATWRGGIVAGQDPIALRLLPSVSIRGRIVCAGWSGDYFGVVGAQGRSSGEIRPDGTFEIEDLCSGRVRLTWRTADVKIADLGDVAAPADGVVLETALPGSALAVGSSR
jgi:hypothetical protein